VTGATSKLLKLTYLAVGISKSKMKCIDIQNAHILRRLHPTLKYPQKYIFLINLKYIIKSFIFKVLQSTLIAFFILSLLRKYGLTMKNTHL